MFRRIALAISLAAPLLTTGTAHATGFLATAFAGEQGHPTTDDPYAVYFNPAGLSLTGGTRLQISGAFGFHNQSYDRPVGAIDNVVPAGMSAAGTPAPDGIGANSGHASASNFVFLPFFGLSTDFGVPNLGVGVGVYVPFGGTASWNPNSAFQNGARFPGAFDGVQRWGVIDGTIDSWYITAAASYRIPDIHLSLGIGINLIINQINTVRARNADGTDNLTASTGALQEGRSYLDVSGVTGGLSAGVIWQPIETVWIGLSYQSQPGFGENELHGTLRNKLGTAPSDQQDVVVLQSLPDIVRIGARWRINPKWEVRLFGEYDRWSVFNHQCILDATNPNRNCTVGPSVGAGSVTPAANIILDIDRQWKDGYNIHAGASFWPIPSLEVFAGLAFDSNSVPDSTIDPSLIDMNKLLSATGARWTIFNNKLTLGLTYTEVIYFDRTSPVRARDADGMAITNQPPARNPDGGGTYSQAVGLLLLQGTYRF